MSEASHPLHPALVHFPIAFWISATVLDGAQRFVSLPEIASLDVPALAHLLLWAGVATAAPAVAAGLVDYARLPAPARDSTAVTKHVAWMGVALCLYLAAALWRGVTPRFGDPASLPVLALEGAGAIALIAGGSAASRLVFRILPSAHNLPPQQPGEHDLRS